MRQLLIAACEMLLAVSAARADNLLVNPGFEELDGPRPRAWSIGAKAELVDKADVARSGRHCVKARFDDAVTQRAAIRGGDAYRIRGWIRRAEPGGAEVPKIKVYFLDAKGAAADVQAAEFKDVAADRWTQWEAIMQAPHHAEVLNLTLRGFFGGTEWFYYDDLAIERVEAPSWPAAVSVPNLHGLTVLVPDIADVWTDALLRIPPASLVPVDGQIDTSVLTRGKDIRVRLQRTLEANWALVHTMRPARALGEADLVAIDQGGPASSAPRRLAGSSPKQELVTSLQFEPAAVGEFLLQIPDKAEVQINEIQLLGLSKADKLAGRPVEMTFSAADPPGPAAEELQRAFAAKEHRGSVVATTATRPGGEAESRLVLPAERYLNLFAAPRTEPFGLAGLRLDLVLPDANPDRLIEVTLHRPEELDVDIRWTTCTDRGLKPPMGRRNHATVFRVVSRVESGRLSATFDVPDLVFASGEPVWLTLRSQGELAIDLARSRVVLGVVQPEEAYAQYVPQLERLVRRMYSDASEAHPYDGSDWSKMVLGSYVRRVLELDPKNMPATYIHRRIAKLREGVDIEEPAGAPAWAFFAREALQNRHEIITWWLDHRQQANGELAGHINDDGEFSCNWPSHYLMTGDQRIAEALRKLADVAWEMSAGTGYTVGSRDVEHAAEDQSCTQPQVLLVDYGSPKAVERLMVMSRYLDFWTAVNPVGRRQFKSYMFNTRQIWEEPPFDVDHPYCPLAMVGAGHLVWYANQPKVSEIFLEEAKSWAAACLGTDGGKPAGAIPYEIRFRDSKVNPYAPYPANPLLQKRDELYRGGAGAYIIRYFLQGAYALTVDDLFGNVLKLWEPPDDRKVREAEAALGRYQAQDSPWEPSQSETTLYDAWRATGDRMWLEQELVEVLRQQVRSRWLLTEAEPYTDRIPLPGRELLSRMVLGDWTSGKSHVPGHWVSWEGGGLDYAAWVLDAKPDHLKALVYSFHQQEQPMTMRIWRLPHGRYDVAIGVDRDGDDQPEEPLRRERMELWRHDGAVRFIARPRQTLVIELSLVEALDDVRARPDLAIGPEDVAWEDGAAVVIVHNLGAAAAPASTLEVRGARGEVLGKAPVPAIEAPHDLEAKTQRVRVELGIDAKPAAIVLDAAGAIAEITEANNACTLRP
ncbi:MAG: hypothetical protein HUU20_23240 [Pirellulales bacterium]|nr:hypothetical protein [Pirellulales bacterium]